jgi:hypothetical protein
MKTVNEAVRQYLSENGGNDPERPVFGPACTGHGLMTTKPKQPIRGLVQTYGYITFCYQGLLAAVKLQSLQRA